MGSPGLRSQDEHLAGVTLHSNLNLIDRVSVPRFMLPQIPDSDGGATLEANVRPRGFDVEGLPAPVPEQEHGAMARERARPDLHIVAQPPGGRPQDSPALHSQRILVHVDDLFVGENFQHLSRHVPHIASDEQRGLHESPDAEVGSAFVHGHAPVANLEHVGIIPPSWPCKIRPLVVLIRNFGHALPIVFDVFRGPPAVAHLDAPCRRIVLAPLAHGVEDLPAAHVERIAHHRVPDLGLALVVVTIVVFQIVHLPRGEGFSVLNFVAERSGLLLAGVESCIRVDAELETQAMDVIGEGFDPGGEGRSPRNEVAMLIALELGPAVVDVDVIVAEVGEAREDQSAGCLEDDVLVDEAVEEIPAVPAHLGRLAQPIVQP
ncbi:hypothetical protein Mapa_002421 [Marchantia paleacea]|nr:hypothetical protein Mapa_002421 [Marchantia paleacea]